MKKIYDKISSSPGYWYGRLGCPISDYAASRDNGAFIQFSKGPSAYAEANPTSPAWVIEGAILQKWLQMNAEWGFMGYPVSDELDYDYGGRISYFQAGVILWHPAVGASAIRGGIFQSWLNNGGTRRAGYPLGDEFTSPGAHWFAPSGWSFDDCPPGFAQQWFWGGGPAWTAGTQRACWNPANGYVDWSFQGTEPIPFDTGIFISSGSSPV